MLAIHHEERMRQYIAIAPRPKAIEPQHVDDGYWNRSQDAITVFESDGRARDTGLLDYRGNPIMSVENTGPIGFGK